MTPEKEITLGHDAKQLLDNPVFQKAMQEIKDGIYRSMTQSALGDESTHHRLVIALQLVGQIETAIKTYVETGEMARIQVNSKMDRLKRVFA